MGCNNYGYWLRKVQQNVRVASEERRGFSNHQQFDCLLDSVCSGQHHRKHYNPTIHFRCVANWWVDRRWVREGIGGSTGNFPHVGSTFEDGLTGTGSMVKLSHLNEKRPIKQVYARYVGKGYIRTNRRILINRKCWGHYKRQWQFTMCK